MKYQPQMKIVDIISNGHLGDNFDGDLIKIFKEHFKGSFKKVAVFTLTVIFGAGCSSKPSPPPLSPAALEANKEFKEYVVKMADDIYPIWEKILNTEYKKDLERVRQRREVLSSSLFMSILKDGSIQKLKSNNPRSAFADAALIKAFKSASPLPLPPSPIARRLAKGFPLELKIAP